MDADYPAIGVNFARRNTVCVIPRALVPKKGLQEAVKEATFPLPRLSFTREAWVLEPKPVMDLLDKIRRNGVPLADYAGVRPYRGITTGFNDAFLITSAERDALVRSDPRSAEIIKPYVSGQDVERWASPIKDQWMIFTRRGVEIDSYPAVKRHLQQYRAHLEPKPDSWQPTGERDKWEGRKEGNYAWYEIQDSIEYWAEFEKPKIIYQELSWWQTFQFDTRSLYLPNTAYLLNTVDPWILAVLNAPSMWWWSWRRAVHGKDEALRFIKEFIVTIPIPEVGGNGEEVADKTSRLAVEKRGRDQSALAIHDWLRTEFTLAKPGTALSEPHRLDADSFVAAVRAALPKKQRLSAADIQRLKEEHRQTVEPARIAADEAQQLERRLSDLVNTAYGLTPEDVKLMWETAPPRMPFTP